MAFLTVLTRHMPARAALLTRNIASLQGQTDPDYEQLVLEDGHSRGWAFARQMLIDAANSLVADYACEYVLILDDDDVMRAPDGIAQLKRAARGAPPVIIFRGRHAELGILPSHSWQGRPECGDIGIFDFILRADVYRECIGAQSASDYAHDHALIAAAYDRHQEAVVWLDAVICAADKRRIGKD